MPEDTAYASEDRAHHYPKSIKHLSRVLSVTDSQAHIQELQETLQILLYDSALCPECVPAHQQKRGIQLLTEQLPLLTGVANWLAPKSIHILEEQTHCVCHHSTAEDCEHFKTCPLHAGRETRVGWSPADTLQQHEGWPLRGYAHLATVLLFGDPPSIEATMRRAVTQALHQYQAQHAERPMNAAANQQLEEVRRAAA